MKIGDKFFDKVGGYECQLVAIGYSDDVALMFDGRVFTVTKKTVNDVLDITEDEFSKMCLGINYVKSDGSPLFPEETYAIGDTLEVVKGSNYAIGDKYLLCQVDYGRCMLVGLKGGNRRRESIQVNDLFQITKDELIEMWSVRKSDVDFKKSLDRQQKIRYSYYTITNQEKIMLLIIDNAGTVMQRIYGNQSLLESLAEAYHNNGYCTELYE